MLRLLTFSLVLLSPLLAACDDEPKAEEEAGLQIKGGGGSINIGPGGIKVEGTDGKLEIKGEGGKLTIEASDKKKDAE